MGVQLAIGEQATTVYADPRQMQEPAARRGRSGQGARHRPEQDLPAAPEQEAELRLRRRARPIPSGRRRSSGAVSPGSASISEERRSYPQHTVASQVLGYAGVDNKGLAGLELGLEHDLAGRPGTETVVRDPFGRTIDVVELDSGAVRARCLPDARPHAAGQGRVGPPDDGRALARRRRHGDRARPEDGWDPRDGRCAGLRRQRLRDRRPACLQRNRAVTDTYEPGSTFKVVTYAAALADKVVTPNTRFTLAAEDQGRRPSHRRRRRRGRPRR